MKMTSMALRSSRRRIAAALSGGVIAAGILVWAPRIGWFSAARADFADADNPILVAQGDVLYRQHCAACHGADLEGQPNWRTPSANGRFPAPPQDQRGHSWMHSDRELLHTIMASVYDVAPPGYVSDMPAFEGALSDQEMTAVLAFIKSRWPIGVRAYQAYLNPGNQGLPKAAVAADWSLPIDCGSEPDRASAITNRRDGATK